MPPITRPRGTNDLLPAESGLRQWVIETHRRVAAAHGYQLIDTPVFEATEMYERGTGVGTDVVEKEMFSFTDRGGRALTLRPEGTPGVLRAVLAAHLEQAHRPVRVHYAGPMFRYARPQAGRYHEFWQLGIEAIGERSPALDAEVIEVAWRFYEALGVTGLSLQVNTLGDLDDRLRYRAALVEYYTPLQERLCEDCRRRLAVNPLRLLDCKRDSGLVSGAPQIGPSLGPESQAFFAEVTALLAAAGIPFQLNPRLVRGLDYYAHTTFELWHEFAPGGPERAGRRGTLRRAGRGAGVPGHPGEWVRPGGRAHPRRLSRAGPRARRPARAGGRARHRRHRHPGGGRGGAPSPDGRDHSRARRLGSPPRPPAGRGRPAGRAGRGPGGGGRGRRRIRHLEGPGQRPSGDRTGRRGGRRAPPPARRRVSRRRGERSAAMSAQPCPPGTMRVAPRRSQRASCGWTNRKDTGIPISVAGLRAPQTGKEKSAVREPTWSSGSAQDSGTGAGVFTHSHGISG